MAIGAAKSLIAAARTDLEGRMNWTDWLTTALVVFLVVMLAVYETRRRR